ncbi:MAG: indole-3-glycerol phosphate synthase TrpC [Bacteroidota bacterium]
MKNILDEILEVKKHEVKKLKRDYSLSFFKDSEFFHSRRFSLSSALTMDANISIIAEIKKASPSKGIIRNIFDHLEIAKAYFNNEVSAVSILTDELFFKGSVKYLEDAAKFKNCPILRKDFIIDESQIFQAKSIGADAILLIAEALSSNQIAELTHAAFENDLEVLLELHSQDQIHKIDFSLSKLIGINNRNLNDFTVSLETTFQIIDTIDTDVIFVSESGINSKDDVDLLQRSKISGILVGEYFMRKNNLDEAIKEMKNWCARES